MTSSQFDIDNLAPIVLTACDLVASPQAQGDTAILRAAFIESNPDTNEFYIGVNGGAYGLAASGPVNTVAPEDFGYVHTLEGPDDMPAHIKSSTMGCALTIPVRNGRLALGTWQGIYLWEHRTHPTRRRLVLTLQGE